MKTKKSAKTLQTNTHRNLSIIGKMLDNIAIDLFNDKNPMMLDTINTIHMRARVSTMRDLVDLLQAPLV